jgi:hypothetical protein
LVISTLFEALMAAWKLTKNHCNFLPLRRRIYILLHPISASEI